MACKLVQYHDSFRLQDWLHWLLTGPFFSERFFLNVSVFVSFILPHAVNCVRFCFGAVSLWFFCLCMKYLGIRWTDFRQIRMEDVFGP